MKTTITEDAGKYLVALDGRLDTACAPDVENELRPLLEVQNKDICVDCKDLAYISSSGLRLFMSLQKACTKNSTKLTLKAMRPEIKEVFEMTGFTLIFTIVD
jgi:anti-anti-sigma factor